MEKTKSEIIAEMNDKFRSTLSGGKVFITQGISALEKATEILDRVQAYNYFTDDNDPFGQHDFGSFDFE